MKKIFISLGCLAVWLVADRQLADENVQGHWCIHELHRAIGDFSYLKRSDTPVAVRAWIRRDIPEYP